MLEHVIAVNMKGRAHVRRHPATPDVGQHSTSRPAPRDPRGRPGRRPGDQRRDHNRQCRSADTEFGARRLDQSAAMDRRRLQPGVRRPGVGRRHHRRPVRPARHADQRPDPVRAQQHWRRAVYIHRSADRDAAGDGSRLGADLPHHAGHHHRYLPGAASTRGRHRRVGRGHRPGRRTRAHSRRRPAGGVLVGQFVSRAGTDRTGRRAGRPDRHPGLESRSGAPARSRRARAVGHHARRAGLHDHRSARPRLGQCAHAGRLRRRAGRCGELRLVGAPGNPIR